VLRAIPNTLTLLNLLSGCLGIVLAFNDQLEWAGLAILVGGLMDFLDGFMARLLKAHSSIGADLDSLADVVTFGVLPSIILFQLIRIGNGNYFHNLEELSTLDIASSALGLLFVVGAALRLAVFNVDESQSEDFKGLPSPAAAIFVAAIPMVLGFQFKFNFYAPLDAASMNWFLGMYHLDAYDQFLINTFRNPSFLVMVAIALAVLMNLRLPFMSLKFKSLRWRENRLRYLFLLISLVIFLYAWAHYVIITLGTLTLEFSSIHIVLILYVLLSLIQAFIPKNEIPS
jgi:CDP-diacylglycerol--serine O-phosphatidyltransferase